MHSTYINKSVRAAVAATAALLALATGCTYTHGPEPSSCTDTAPATYAAVISPIFEAHYRECYGTTVYQTLGGGNNYSNCVGIKRQSASLILGLHPPRPGLRPDAQGRGPACDIARIQAWIDAGQPDN